MALPFELVGENLLLPLPLFLLVENPLPLHSGGEAFGQAAALAEAPRVDVDVALGLEEALGGRKSEGVAPEKGFARLAGDGVEIVAESGVAADRAPFVRRRQPTAAAAADRRRTV